MELVFLACFVFGAAFTLVSVVLSMAGFAGHGAHGHAGVARQLPHAHVPHAHAPVHGHGHAVAHAARAGGRAPVRALLPLLNASSLLAFLTWFGAAGYLLLRGGWPLLVVLPIAIVAGLAAATLIGWFLTRLAAGERVMDPRDYALVGAGCRVTVGIPAGGVGEVVFSLAGARRSEAARGSSGQAIPRGTEVIIIAYARGVADVMTLDELTSPRALDGPGNVAADRMLGE